MAHAHWIFPIDLSGDEEAKQARERQPYFMLQCSKFLGASFMNEVSKKDIPDLTIEGYLYKSNVECQIAGTYYFVLDRHCAYLIGVFSWETSNGGRFVRAFFPQFEEIRGKAAIFLQIEKEFKKIQSCVGYQQIVQSLLQIDSNEYRQSFELLSFFSQKSHELKNQIDCLKKEIEIMVDEYVMKGLGILHNPSEGTTGINIQGTIKHYLEYFLSK
jgi:hypothetical protein